MVDLTRGLHGRVRARLLDVVPGRSGTAYLSRRLRVKPGLTGLWQVSGRSDLTWDEAMRLDLRYVDNWSVAMDALILWKTARAVFGAAGAYLSLIHISEPTRLGMISYAVFCLKKKKKKRQQL